MADGDINTQDAPAPSASCKAGRAPTTSTSPQHQPSFSGIPSTSTRHSRRSSLQTQENTEKSEIDTTEKDTDASFDQMSPAANDRVFPIRSVISVAATPTPTARVNKDNGCGFPAPEALSITTSGGGLAGRRLTANHKSARSTLSTSSPSEASYVEPASQSRNASRGAEVPSIFGGGRTPLEHTRPSVDSGCRPMQACFDGVFNKSESVASAGDKEINAGSIHSQTVEPEPIYTARFKHVVTNEGHAVIVGRDGGTLQRCEDEPIHIPGAVQSFGLLIALQEVEASKLQVRIVSENSERIIGYTPQRLFALESFCDILSEEQTENLLDHVDFIRDEEGDPAINGPEVFTMSIRSPRNRLQKVWCAMHINDANKDLIICEFELENDIENPLVPPGEATPESPEDTLHTEATEAELAESTTNMSKPLRVLRSARKRRSEAAAMDVFNIMSQVQEQMANAPNLDAFLKVLVGVVKELTGFHRVMIYQFDQAWNGRVVTELVDPQATKDLYKGLNFPASDIPKQARDLYKINKVRLLYDRDQETARLVCRTIGDLDNPLDLTYAYLRAMSPIHIKYLANMAVRSSMSISINAFGELWGLIACHTYGSKGMRVSFPVRRMCRIIGDSASRNIERLSYASRLQARKLINTAPTETNPSGYIIASSEDLLTLFDADCGLLSIKDETKMLGTFAQTQEALAVLEYLRMRRFTSVTHSTKLSEDFPDLRYGPGFKSLAGLLLVPLTVSGDDFIIFFRKSQLQEVRWAGNPYEKFVKEGTEGYLEPRKSFRMWTETVVGRCKTWTDEQIETAAVLCLVYGKFIEVWRQKEVALQSVPLTRLLLANTAHEVRTPLNAIINYLEIALEGSIDQETRENLAKSHSASKSLIYVINDLLDLTKTEEGQDLIVDEVFDFEPTVRVATDAFAGEAKRKQIAYSVHNNGGIPPQVIGDSRRVRQIVSNVTANAVKHTIAGAVKIELWLVEKSEKQVVIDIAVQDTGCGISAQKLDSIFNELEQVQTENDEALKKRLGPDAKFAGNGDNPSRTLGLGLAVVARTIRNMDGQLRVKSEEGKGTRIVMQLGFDLPSSSNEPPQITQSEALNPGLQKDLPVTPPVEEGEVMLVKKSARKEPTSRDSSLKARKSVESMNSLKSIATNSTGKSDVDRLIEAIQEPPGSPRPRSSGVFSPVERPSSRRSLGQPSLTPSRRPSSTAQTHHFDSNLEPVPGQASVTDSKTPVKPISVPSNSSSGLAADLGDRRTPAKILFNTKSQDEGPLARPCADRFRVLVAEDDPINSRIIKKRLEKVGHRVQMTVNGEECASAYGDNAMACDVVLMDMQMPIVDGLTSVKMIRSFEKSTQDVALSRCAALHGRVPILAVSASLEERERQKYVDAGFDGWILKPIDFSRLSGLLRGIVDKATRESCVYTKGQWERGGWFLKEQADPFGAKTSPSGEGGVGGPAAQESFPSQAGPDVRDEEQDRLESLDSDAVHATSKPSQPGTSGDIEHSVLER